MPELSGQRMPIKNYYMAGMACHPAHGIGRGQSYNAYKLITQDFNLKYKPWEERGW
jgi:phytoene dehydrogenase-like protein